MTRQQCEFFLLRYVPDPVRDEFVHVGVILREAVGAAGAEGTSDQAGKRGIALRFTSDWRRVRCLDPGADIGMLEGLESELRRRLAGEAKTDANLLSLLEDSFSNSLQITRAKGYLAESVEAGIEELMRMYVEPPKRERAARLSGRAAIQASMRSEFERAGVWDLLRKRISVAEYTRPGDPLRIDMGYRPNGVIRMFHAVSLDSSGASKTTGSGVQGSNLGIEMAKVLAFSEAGLRAGIERVEKATLELTAVVEPVRHGSANGAGEHGKRRTTGEAEAEIDWDPDRLAAYRFAVETMEEHRIRVLTTLDMGRAAETARRELRV